MVMGGIGVDGVTSKVERYHAEKDAWRPMADMLTRRAYCSCAELYGRVVVVGGCDQDYNKLNTVEEYSPAENAWYYLPSMNVKRQGCSVVVLEGKLVVMGGWDGEVWPHALLCSVMSTPTVVRRAHRAPHLHEFVGEMGPPGGWVCFPLMDR